MLLTPLYVYVLVTYEGPEASSFVPRRPCSRPTCFAGVWPASAVWPGDDQARMPYLLDLLTLLMEAGATFFRPWSSRS